MDDSEIPADIMQAARECCDKETFRLMAVFGKTFLDEGTVKAVARALKAERARIDTNVTRILKHYGGCPLDFAADNILDAVRNKIREGG